MHSVRGVTETSHGRERRRGARRAAAASDDPFAVLGLPALPGLSDDDVQAAWRRIAAATHPDREDGGDPARFGAAAAAYAELRTGFGRGEVLADLGLGQPADQRGRHGRHRGRSTDPAARGGRHRARGEPLVGRRVGAGRRGLTRLAGWITRRATTRDPADAATRDPTRTAADVSGEAPADVLGDAAAPRRRGDVEEVADATLEAGSVRREPLGVAGRSFRWRMSRRSSTWRPVRSRLRRRPGWVALRVAGVAAVGVVAVVISGWSPGVVGVLAGVLTWLAATAGRALARRRSQ